MTMWIGDPARQAPSSGTGDALIKAPPSMYATYFQVSKTRLKWWRIQPVMERDCDLRSRGFRSPTAVQRESDSPWHSPPNQQRQMAEGDCRLSHALRRGSSVIATELRFPSDNLWHGLRSVRSLAGPSTFRMWLRHGQSKEKQV